MRAVLACPWPLYVRVLMKEAVTWRSSLDVSQIVLPNSVEAAINGLLDHVEQRLGVVFVSHTLTFITAAHNGLCEVDYIQYLPDKATRYDTIRYGRLTCAQKLTRWPA